MRHWKMLGLAGFAVVAAGMLTAAAAWACVPTATLNVSPAQAKPGDTVQITGNSYNKNPVLIHFGALDGPVVATLTPVSGSINGSMVVPSGTAPGNYVLVATEDAAVGSQTWGIPVRAVLGVGSDAGPAPALPTPAALARAAGLTRSSSTGSGPLVLAGIGGAGVALLLAGLGTYVAGSRRRPAAESEPVTPRP